MPKDEVDRRVREVGHVLHLEEIFKRKPKKLSAGDQQRVALARAMVRQPKVYLMDEPLSNLDAQLRVEMRVELRRIQLENKTTTVYVTHDQVEAMAMADRIAIMNKGNLLQIGTPDEVYAYPANLFVANFIGSPSMNFIRCTYEAATHDLIIGTNGEQMKYHLPEHISQRTDQLPDGTKLILGVRPEDVSIHTEAVDGALELRMALLESLGSENIHHLIHNELRIIARTSPADIFSDDQRLWIKFIPEGMRLFDQNTEIAI